MPSERKTADNRFEHIYVSDLFKLAIQWDKLMLDDRMGQADALGIQPLHAPGLIQQLQGLVRARKLRTYCIFPSPFPLPPPSLSEHNSLVSPFARARALSFLFFVSYTRLPAPTLDLRCGVPTYLSTSTLCGHAHQLKS